MCNICLLDLSYIEITDDQKEEYYRMLEDRGDDEEAPWMKDKEQPTIH